MAVPPWHCRSRFEREHTELPTADRYPTHIAVVAVSLTGHGDDPATQQRPESTAQLGSGVHDRRLLDNPALPHRGEQFVLGEGLARPLKQCAEQCQRTRLQRDNLPVDAQVAPRFIEFGVLEDVAELIVGHLRRIHPVAVLE